MSSSCTGDFGDHVASLVAIDYIDKRYPWISQLVWAPDFLIELAKNVLNKRIQIKGFSQMKGEYQPTKATKSTEWDGKTSPMKTHLIDYAFAKLCDENPSIDYKNYLQVDLPKIKITQQLPEKYIVVTSGYTANVREFPAKSINEIVQYAKSKGYEPVFLGQTQTPTGGEHVIKGEFDKHVDFTAGVNLVNQTTLLQAAGIISDAKAVVGVDNGLMQLAGCTQTAIVGGFTTVAPRIRWPIRHSQLGWNCFEVVPTDLPCMFCQENTNFLFGHDYRNCLYKDRLCVSQMTSDKFIAHLETIL